MTGNWKQLCLEFYEIAMNICMRKAFGPSSTTAKIIDWLIKAMKFNPFAEKTQIDAFYNSYHHKPNNLTQPECFDLMTSIYKRFRMLHFHDDEYRENYIESSRDLSGSDNSIYLMDFLMYLNACLLVSCLITYFLFRNDNVPGTRDRKVTAKANIKNKAETSGQKKDDSTETSFASIIKNSDESLEDITMPAYDSTYDEALAGNFTMGNRDVSCITFDRPARRSSEEESTLKLRDLVSVAFGNPPRTDEEALTINSKINYFNEFSYEPQSTSTPLTGSSNPSKSSLTNLSIKSIEKKSSKNFLNINIDKVKATSIPTGSAHRNCGSPVADITKKSDTNLKLRHKSSIPLFKKS